MGFAKLEIIFLVENYENVLKSVDFQRSGLGSTFRYPIFGHLTNSVTKTKIGIALRFLHDVDNTDQKLCAKFHDGSFYRFRDIRFRDHKKKSDEVENFHSATHKNVTQWNVTQWNLFYSRARKIMNSPIISHSLLHFISVSQWTISNTSQINKLILTLIVITVTQWKFCNDHMCIYLFCDEIITKISAMAFHLHHSMISYVKLYQCVWPHNCSMQQVSARYKNTRRDVVELFSPDIYWPCVISQKVNSQYQDNACSP